MLCVTRQQQQQRSRKQRETELEEENEDEEDGAAQGEDQEARGGRRTTGMDRRASIGNGTTSALKLPERFIYNRCACPHGRFGRADALPCMHRQTTRQMYRIWPCGYSSSSRRSLLLVVTRLPLIGMHTLTYDAATRIQN